MDADLAQLSPTLSIWHRYAPAVRADLFSSCLETADGAFLVDPIQPPPDFLGAKRVAGIVVTNNNHARAAADIACRLIVPIYARAEVRDGLENCRIIRLRDNQDIAPGLTAIPLAGAPPGEIALHHEADGGTLIVGDALINMESLGFTFLPAKYCENAKVMRRSLRNLLDYSFERIFFAHGTPIISRAHSRLSILLNGNGEISHE